MLKKFFMNMLSSFVGAWIALALFGVVAVMVGISLVGKFGFTGNSADDSLEKGSVLTIGLAGEISERETATEVDYFALMQGEVDKPQTLNSLLEAISEAKENKNISAIYLKCQGVGGGLATLHALRDALNDFKGSGKKIIAYGSSYTMGDYYVASVSDLILMNPGGMLGFKGLGGTSLYLKNLFDKIGVEFQVVKVGTYKSAVEPYIHNEMSEPARAQLDTLYGTLWKSVREDISLNRKKLKPEEIDSLTNKYLFAQSAEKIKGFGFVDRLVYERSVDSIIADFIGKDVEKLHFAGMTSLPVSLRGSSNLTAKNRIAVLYACGEIEDGGGQNAIDYKRLVPVITSLAEDKNVKGMVLRVNSPGGSAFGSEQIGEALDYFKSQGKPLAVSMGDYAASGGYWISAGADRIFADQMTITGSIGIFGLIPNASGLMEKIGVTPISVSTNPNANFPSLFQPMDEGQLQAMQEYVERGYDQFVERVAKGRKMSVKKVRRIGEGRVWSAQKALEIGLVDQLGSLNEAVEWVAGKAGIEDSYVLADYPEIETSFWDFIPELGNLKLHDAMQKAFSDDYGDIAVRFAANVLQRKPVQARMPYVKVRF